MIFLYIETFVGSKDSLLDILVAANRVYFSEDVKELETLKHQELHEKAIPNCFRVCAMGRMIILHFSCFIISFGRFVQGLCCWLV